MYRNIIIIYDEFPMEKAEYELVPGQWSDEDVLAEYDGNIIQDVSLDWEDGTNGWRECEY